MTKYFIKKGIGRAAKFGQSPNNIGIGEQDYNKGKWVEVSEQQADFYSQNKHASFSEIISMKMTQMPNFEVSIEEKYKNLVVLKIREKYSIDDEIAIQRKRDVEQNKFDEYNIFCEKCKLDAKKELGINE